VGDSIQVPKPPFRSTPCSMIIWVDPIEDQQLPLDQLHVALYAWMIIGQKLITVHSHRMFRIYHKDSALN